MRDTGLSERTKNTVDSVKEQNQMPGWQRILYSSASVSESAKEAEIRSLQNQTEAEQAKELLGKMLGLVQQLKKYQE